jgi:hypothetical protein
MLNQAIIFLILATFSVFGSPDNQYTNDFLYNIDDIPEASYDIATATHGIASAYNPFMPNYHYYDAFYPLYNNDKPVFYNFEEFQEENKAEPEADKINTQHRSNAENIVEHNEDIRQKEEDIKRTSLTQ